jgi:hypothetical protein
MCANTRRFLVVLFAFGVASAAFVSAARANDSSSGKVKVFTFVHKDSSGFSDQRTQELDATLKDVREAIVKRKNPMVELVEAEEQADIVLEITERTLVERVGSVSTNTTYSKDGRRASSTSSASKEHDVVLKAVMHVGSYTNELTGQCDLGYLFGGAYRQAAKNLVGSLESWVKSNAARLQVK